MMLLALLLLVPQTTRKEATYYYADAYSPTYLIRRQPWQAIAVDSKGNVYVAHPFDTGANNRPVPSGRRLQIFSPEGELLAEHSSPNGMAAFGLAVDEAGGKIYGAANQQHGIVFDWRGPGRPLTLLPGGVAKKEGGRCVGISLGRDGSLFTADLADNKVYRFYRSGGFSSFGSGPGDGDQGFNDLRRVFESPVTGNLYTLDRDGIRLFTPAGTFVRRIGPRVTDENGILAMGPDGRLLASWGADLALLDGEGAVLKKLPIATATISDAALGKDGRIVVIPRGPEFCYAAYGADGTLLFRRGADFDRLTVTLDGRKAKVEFTNALRAGLLSGAAKKAAEARPQSPPVSVFVRDATSPWRRIEGELPAGGGQRIRFTTASEPEGVGPAVEFSP